MSNTWEPVDEIARWQGAIYELLQRYAEPLDILIDGAGSDGDELDFTLAEIEQLIAGLIDKLDEAQPTPPVPSEVRRAIEEMCRITMDYAAVVLLDSRPASEHYQTIATRAANWLTAQEGARDGRDN